MAESRFIEETQSYQELYAKGLAEYKRIYRGETEGRVIRLGLIGCGNFGGAHLEGIKKLKRAKLTAVCDILEDRALSAKKWFGAEHAFIDYKDMLPYVDAVIIATCHDTHHEISKFFMENGVHVSCEKSLCHTEEECLDLIETAERMGVKFACAYPVPHWPAIQMIRKIIEEKTYGDVIQMSIWTEQYTNPFLTTGGKPLHEVTEINGGGQFFCHGCHYVDLLLRCLGNPVAGVHFGSHVGTPWLEKEGTSNMVMTFENGATAYHFGTWAAVGSRNGYTFQVHFTEGFLNYEIIGETMTFIKNKGPDLDIREARKIEWHFEEAESSHYTEIEDQDFVDSILEDRDPIVTGKDALQSLRVIWKLYEAEEKGEIADLRGLGIEPKKNAK